MKANSSFPIAILVVIILSLGSSLSAQSFRVIRNHSEFYQEIYLQKTSVWIIPTPIAFKSYSFSTDFGRTFQKAGMLGERVKPLLVNNAEAVAEINKYAVTRFLGVAQMVYCPTAILLAMRTSNSSAVTPLVLTGLLSFYTGSLTYHVIAPGFLKAALSSYYSDMGKPARLDNVIPDIYPSYNVAADSPVLSMRWTF